MRKSVPPSGDNFQNLNTLHGRNCEPGVLTYHNENMPMQYTGIFIVPKNENFQQKKMIFFLFLLKT